MQVVFDELVGGFGCAGDMACHLLTANPGTWVKREKAVGGITGLFLEFVEGDAASIHPGWGAGFETPCGESQIA